MYDQQQRSERLEKVFQIREKASNQKLVCAEYVCVSMCVHGFKRGIKLRDALGPL